MGAERQNESLHLYILDNGEDFAGDGTLNSGVGLTNVQLRLDHLYGKNREFRIGKTPARETLVKMTIPLR